MGWFDNEQEEGTANPAAPKPTSSRPMAKSSAPTSTEGGSTLGREIHIDGSIVCDEDLTILGHVDGTIRAKGTLVIAKEADVHATIDGQRVMVHGKVEGNVYGAERVVLGQTARLMGNIETPTLEIIEGARFKGNVEMQAPKAAKPEPASKPVPVAAKSDPGRTDVPAPKPAGREGSSGASKTSAP
jgi:cytoskeletal protein CcmA (bactofilin family)